MTIGDDPSSQPRRRPLRTLLLSVLALAAVALLAALPVGTAQALNKTYPDWSLTGTPGDIVGAWAHGSMTAMTVYGQGDRLYLQGYIKDTASDGYGARVKFRTNYKSGYQRADHVDVGGYQAEESFLFTYDYQNVTTQDGQECIYRTVSGQLQETCPNAWTRLLTR